MRPLSFFVLAAALFGSQVIVEAQVSDEERQARMEERRANMGKGKGRGEDSAPKAGSQAPDLGVRKLLDGTDFNLSDPNRISVLIFGSHT